jgi:uncharacterized LabA/DUF88 family protein
MTNTVCYYVDGFNVYHAIKQLGDARLKWLDLYGLCSSFESSADKVTVKYFTAHAHWLEHAVKKHKQYIRALESTGVEVVLGSFKTKERHCTACKVTVNGHEEKETDVAIGVHMVHDAHLMRYSKQVLVSADSDLLPALKILKNHFASSTSVHVLHPPNRRVVGQVYRLLGKRNVVQITEADIRAHRFDDVVAGVRCPDEYL